MTLLKQFRKWQKEHPNFVTPTIVKLKEKGPFIIELSKGRGIMDEKDVYGVSLLMFTADRKGVHFQTVINRPKKIEKHIKLYHTKKGAEKGFKKLSEVI